MNFVPRIQDGRSTVEPTNSTPTSTLTSPPLQPKVNKSSVSERFSPEKLKTGNPEKYWWGRLTPTGRFRQDLPYFHFKGGRWLLLVYGACHPGHTVRVRSKGEPLDVEVREVIRRFSHHRNGRDLTLCEFWSHKPENGPYKKWVKVKQRDTVPQSWDATYTTIGRDRVPEKSKMPVGRIWRDVKFPDMENYGLSNRDLFVADYWSAMRQHRIAPWKGRVLGDIQVGELFYGWSFTCSTDRKVLEVIEVIRRCRDRQGRKVTRVKTRESSKNIRTVETVLLSASYCKPKGIITTI